ncbi:MAG: glycosyltransferase, partial [Myxococcales bacterium]|nr:glycosyltransferase [Myxococcales bacterium]
CLARLVELKGVDVAIEAARGARYALVIAGEGPQRAALEAAARRLGVGARFVGLVSGRAKEHLLAAADLLVAPSRRDAAPVTLLEALDAGVPVVASDVGDNRALLGAEAVVPAGDSAALARAIAAQLASTPDAAALRARAAPYRWAGVARRIRALLG